MLDVWALATSPPAGSYHPCPCPPPHTAVLLQLIVRTPTVRLQIISGLVGRHNAANILAAVAAGLAMGAPADVIVSGIEAVETVPGRCVVTGVCGWSLSVQ
jgi:UDP-N-acetylmuramyl pentapeptide synthase